MSLPKSDGKGRSGLGESPGRTGVTGINDGKLINSSVPKAKFCYRYRFGLWISR